MEVTSPYFDLDETNVVDNSTSEFEYIEYLPRDSNNMNKDVKHILETRDEDVRGRLQTAADANFAANVIISLVNNGWALFHSAEYQINNRTIEDVSNYLPYASTILNTVMFSDDYSRSTASNMMWFRDTGDGKPTLSTDLVPPGGAADANAVRTAVINGFGVYNANRTVNIGFTARQSITTGNKQISLFLPLSQIFGFCKDIHTVFRGVKHTLLLDRVKPDDYIMKHTGAAAGKFNISHISLWMPKVVPSIALQTALEEKLVSGHIKNLYFEQVRVYRTMFQATETSPSWRITTLSGSELPRHIFIALQSSDRLPAANPQNVNNMIFDNGNLMRISVRVNSVQYPEREFECNFTPANRNYSRSYAAFLDAVNKYQDTDTGCQLSAEDWASLYPIHHFDVSKHNERLKDSMADIVVQFNLSGNFRNIADNGDVPYYVYAVILSDRFLELQGLSGRMNVII